MVLVRFPKRLHRPIGILLLSLLAGAGSVYAQAQAMVSERLLGLSEQDVIAALPGVTKNANPPRGPRGGRGLLSLASADVAGLSFEVTFYFRGKLLERIEERRRTPDNRCQASYAALLASLDARYGAGFHSDAGNAPQADDGQDLSAAWVVEGFKVMAYRRQSANQCDLLVAMEPHAQRDSSEL